MTDVERDGERVHYIQIGGVGGFCHGAAFHYGDAARREVKGGVEGEETVEQTLCGW